MQKTERPDVLKFKVEGLPPRKDGAASMWGAAQAERVVALRVAAAAALGSRPPFAGPLKVEVAVRATESQGDLDNFVSGILDALQVAGSAAGWRGVPTWERPDVQAVRPDQWRAVVDDTTVREIRARRVRSGPPFFYEVTVTDPTLASAAGVQVAWLEEAKEHLFQEATQMRSGLRFWMAMRNANPERWFGGSWDLHFESQNAVLGTILMRLRRFTDEGSGRDITLPNALRGMLAVAADEDKPRLSTGLELALALPDRQSVRHLRQLADKVLAHANPAGLAHAGGQVPGLAHDQYNVRTFSEAVAEVTDVYRRFVNPNLITTDATYGGDDPFHRRIVDKGLPALDYPPEKVYGEGYGEDWDVHYVTVERAAWEAAVASLPRPWPREVALVDARMWWAQEDRDLNDLPGRWGWSLEEVARVVFDGKAGW